MNTDANITVLGEMRFSRVNAHSDADLSVGRPRESGERELRADRSRGCASSALERDEESVARRVDLASAVCRKRIAQQPTVVGTNHRKHVVTKAPHEIRRLFDVTEEEGHCAMRQWCAAHRIIFAP
jgi:hypothetical protein